MTPPPSGHRRAIRFLVAGVMLAGWGVSAGVAGADPEPAPPPTVTSTPGLSVYDQNFISLMSQEGWGCTDVFLLCAQRIIDEAWPEAGG